jgi:hypothetical protein
MSPHYYVLRRRLFLLLATSCCAVVALPRPLAAQETAPGAGAMAAPVTRTQNVTINLINRLVERGVLTPKDSAELIQMAEEDAVIAKAEAEAAKKETVAAAVASLPAPVAAPAADADVVSVTYIPEYVKAQIKEEIRQDVMTTAADENWADPHSYPDWMANFQPSGDIRLRFESQSFPSGNVLGSSFDFNKINTGSPYDNSAGNPTPPPQFNADQDRERARLRARLAAQIDMGEGFISGFRIATGSDSSPVTQNQTLSGFSKYSLWLDRGFLSYAHNDGKGSLYTVAAGRMDNPFFTTSSIIWANDIGFDGVAFKTRRHFGETFTPFFTVGAFPVYNTDLNFATNNASKFKSDDKYLYGAQLGAEFTPTKDVVVKVAVSLYEYQNIEGKLSTPFIPLTANDAGDTDASRPSFAQRGNTYTPLRNITPDATLNANGTTNQFQYFGLATPFRELAFSARVDFNHFEPLQVSLLAEGVRNLAFDSADVAGKAVNNFGSKYEGGDTAWLLGVQFGHASLEKRWDWNASLNFRHVESDAVVDGFADSDFGGGGTNVEGFTVGGNLALSRNVWLGLRWLSSTTIAGPENKSDILQFDINGKF